MNGSRGHGHVYLPAMGDDRLLRLYDPVSRLLGVHRVHRRLIRQAAVHPGTRALEIGCGTGNLALQLKRRHPEVDVSGLDPDPDALALAQRKAARRDLDVRWELGSATALPYPDERTDRVLSALMFHHIDKPDRELMLAEAFRVLRPGGSVHLVDMVTHRDAPGTGRSRRRGSLAADAEIITSLENAGFTVIRSHRRRLTYYRASR